MTQQQIEGNELIKNFLGNITADTKEWVKTDKKLVEEYKFHSSWDWLMPVVEKIEALDNIYIEIVEKSCYIHDLSLLGLKFNPNLRHLGVQKNKLDDTLFVLDGRTKLEAVWIACVEFIKWYNQNKTK